MTEFRTLRDALYSMPPSESLRVGKSEMPELPPEFEPTTWGTPTWIAHPGAVGQYRAPEALHAYDVEDAWDLHRDRYDPKENPIGHFLFDAPELAIAAGVSMLVGGLTYSVLEGWDAQKSENDGKERPAWVRGLIALGVAVIAFFAVYLLGAMVRVRFGAA
jgi:hypothetical protein